MQWFHALKLAPRLLLIFSLIIVMMLVQTLISWTGMSRMDQASTALATQNMARMQTIGQLGTALSQYRNDYYQSLIRASDEVRAQGQQNAAQRRTAINATIARFQGDHPEAAASQAFATFLAQWEQAQASYDEVSELIVLELPDDAIDIFVSDTRLKHQQASDALEAYGVLETEQGEQAQADADTAYTASLWGLVIAMLIGGAAGAALVIWFTAAMVARMRHAVSIAHDVAAGRLDGQINARGGDEIADLLRAMARMQHDLRERIERDAEIAAQNLRIRKSLDASGTPLYIADGQLQIIYANPALESLLSRYQDACKAHLQGYDAGQPVVGQSVQVLNPNGEVDKLVLDDLKRNDSSRRNLVIGPVTWAQDIACVRDEAGEVAGYVVEFRDRTLELQVEQEIDSVVSGAAQGDFERRIDTAGKDGFFASLASQVNQLLDGFSGAMGQVSVVLSALAERDLTQRMEGDHRGAFAAIANDVNGTSQALAQIMGQIAQAAEAINAAAGEIASGNADLSQRTEQQAANLEETAASMEELTSTVRQNAEHARQANQLAVGAADVAARGGQVTQAMVGTMSQIEQSSRKIADIISVIDGIAFQTNILALNAAVEAARAGEQGRGFAVVASEVRTLAQRSAAAAKEIKHLIDDSVAKVADGSALVHQAGNTMGEIVSSVQRVTDIMAEISAASQEQAAGIEQVNQTIVQMDETTQQNAALVEEATAAARAMEEQSASLAQAIAVFRIEGGHAPGTTAAPATPTPSTTTSRPAFVPVRKAARTVPASRIAGNTALADNEWSEF